MFVYDLFSKFRSPLQLQYYESEDRTTYRGFIALDNVKSVKQTELRRSSSTPVKKLPEHAYIIEVRPRKVPGDKFSMKYYYF